jgi:hypothetical protein
MSVIFEGIEMPKACCFVDGEHTPFAHFEYCKFYKICKKRETIETNFRPNDCPVKPINQEMITKNDLGVDCVSRQAVDRLVWKYLRKETDENIAFYEHFLELPSVTPIRPKGHWELVQRGKYIDVCCSNCEAVRIKEYAYNYTIDQLDKEDLKECFECADMRYCPNCGSDNREVKE